MLRFEPMIKSFQLCPLLNLLLTIISVCGTLANS